MTTEKQIEANRRNAAKSTGPRTEAGKARAAQNAVKHGLTSRRVLLGDEDGEEYAALLENLHADLEPQSQLEVLLVNRLAAQQWRLARVPAIEAELLERLRADGLDPWGVPDPALGGAWARDAGPYGGALGRLVRYETALERSAGRLLAELRRVQAARRRDDRARVDARPWPARAADEWPGAPLGGSAGRAGASQPATAESLRNEPDPAADPTAQAARPAAPAGGAGEPGAPAGLFAAADAGAGQATSALAGAPPASQTMPAATSSSTVSAL